MVGTLPLLCRINWIFNIPIYQSDRWRCSEANGKKKSTFWTVWNSKAQCSMPLLRIVGKVVIYHWCSPSRSHSPSPYLIRIVNNKTLSIPNNVQSCLLTFNIHIFPSSSENNLLSYLFWVCSFAWQNKTKQKKKKCVWMWWTCAALERGKSTKCNWNLCL